MRNNRLYYCLLITPENFSVAGVRELNGKLKTRLRRAITQPTFYIKELHAQSNSSHMLTKTFRLWPNKILPAGNKCIWPDKHNCLSQAKLSAFGIVDVQRLIEGRQNIVALACVLKDKKTSIMIMSIISFHQPY